MAHLAEYNVQMATLLAMIVANVRPSPIGFQLKLSFKFYLDCC